MDPKVAEKFAQALAECAVRQNHAGLRKEAAAYQLIKQAEGDLRSSPYIYAPAIGALLGGAGGYFSDDDEKKKLRNILYGVGIGGLSGLGVAGLTQLATRARAANLEQVVPTSSPAVAQDPAVTTAGGVAANNKNQAKGTEMPVARALTTTMAASAGGMEAARRVRPPAYSVERHARNLKPDAKNTPDTQRLLAQNLRSLHNTVAQHGGINNVTDHQLLGVSATRKLDPGQLHQAATLRRIYRGEADFGQFAEGTARMGPKPGGRGGQRGYTKQDITPQMYGAGRRVSVRRRGLYGTLAAVLAGVGADTAQNYGAPVLDYVGEAAGNAAPNWFNW